MRDAAAGRIGKESVQPARSEALPGSVCFHIQQVLTSHIASFLTSHIANFLTSHIVNFLTSRIANFLTSRIEERLS